MTFGSTVRVPRLFEDSRLRVSEYRSVHIAAYLETPTVETLRIADQHHASLRARYPGQTGVFSYVRSGLTLPDAATRRVATELLSRFGAELRGSATILAGEGFWASAAISFLGGLNLIVRLPRPTRQFLDIDQGARWLAPLLGDPVATPEALATALRALLEP